MSNNEIPKGFNMTELGALPEGWGAKTLVDIATLQRGKDLPKQNQILGPYPIVGSSGIIGCHNRCVCAGPGVITGRSGSIGKLIYVEKDYWPHNTCLYVKDFHANNPKFIYYLLHLLDFKKYATGVSVPTLNRNSIHSALLPIPPLPEQHRIAAVLSAVQDAKEKTGAVIAAAKSLKKSLMRHLFTYGPVPAGAVESVPLTETEIGLVPDGWEVVRLGGVAETRKETVDPRNSKSKYVGLEHINPGECSLKRFGYSDDVRSAKSKFYLGDILYGKLRPYLDKCILVDFEGICSTDIIVVKTNNNASNTFLSYFLHTDEFREYAAKTMTGVNHPRTSWRALSQFSIPLPPHPTQQKIASILSTVDKKIEVEENKNKALDEVFKSLLHNLMTAKIRVNHLDVVQ